MEANKDEFEKYVLAKNRVEDIKRFYTHVVFFLAATVLVLVFKGRLIDFPMSKGVTDGGFCDGFL